MRSRRISPCCAVTLETATQKSDEISRISAAPASARLFLAKIDKNHACYVQTWSRPRLCSSAWSLCKFACRVYCCMLLLGPSWLSLHGEASLYLYLHRHLHLYLYLVPCARMTRTNREVDQVYFYLVYLHLCLSLSLSPSSTLSLPPHAKAHLRVLAGFSAPIEVFPCRALLYYSYLFISRVLLALSLSLSGMGPWPMAHQYVTGLVGEREPCFPLSLSLSLALCLCLSFSLHRSVSGALYMQLRLRQAGVAPRREDSLLSQPGISYSVRTMPMSPAPTARLGL